jgi:hypothetical protein
MGTRPVDLSYELKREKRHVRRELSGSLMSNTKWRVVFETLKAPSLAVKQIIVKFIDVDSPKCMEMPWTSAPYPYLNSLSFGPFPIVGIEWVEIPTEAIFEIDGGIPAKRFPQDTIAVRRALEATGKQLPLTDTGTGLRITGHAR